VRGLSAAVTETTLAPSGSAKDWFDCFDSDPHTRYWKILYILIQLYMVTRAN